jgi:hypothetical protein
MRRGFGLGAAILVVLLLVGIGIGAYNWGVSDGLDHSGKAVEVVRYVGGHGGFFPFFLIFPLFFLALFAFKGAMWRRHGHDHGPGGHDHGPGGHDHGPGGHGRWEQGFEDWHRRQHEAKEEGRTGGADEGGEPA